jgi:hypothetical protein
MYYIPRLPQALLVTKSRAGCLLDSDGVSTTLLSASLLIHQSTPPGNLRKRNSQRVVLAVNLHSTIVTYTAAEAEICRLMQATTDLDNRVAHTYCPAGWDEDATGISSMRATPVTW